MPILPAVNLAVSPVRKTVITSAVVRNAITHEFQQNWTSSTL